MSNFGLNVASLNFVFVFFGIISEVSGQLGSAASLFALISQEPHLRTSTNFTHVARGSGVLLPWRRRDTLCTSGL